MKKWGFAGRLSWRDFSLNPVALKELRQLVRAKILIAAMVIYPMLLFAVTVGMMAMRAGFAAAKGTPVQAVTVGPQVFAASAAGLALIACILFPALSGIDMVKESAKDSPDFMFLTAMRPIDIVSGKMLATFLVSLVFAGITAPFMAFAYLLRGITLEIVVLTFAAVLLLSPMFSALTLANAVFCARARVQSGANTRLSCYGVLWPYFLLCSYGSKVIGHHVVPKIGSSLTATRGDVVCLVAAAVLAVLLTCFFRALAASVLMSQNSDYNGLLRRVETWSLLACCPLAYAVAREFPGFSDSIVGAFAVAMSFVAVAIGSRAMIAPSGMTRVCAAKAPRSFFSRLLKFPFASCSESGVVYSLLFAAFAVASALVMSMSLGLTSDSAGKAMAIYGEMMLLPLVAVLVMKALHVPEKVVFHVSGGVLFFLAFSGSLLELLQVVNKGESMYGNVLGILNWGAGSEVHRLYAAVSMLILVPLAVVSAIPAFRAFRRRDAAESKQAPENVV